MISYFTVKKSIRWDKTTCPRLSQVMLLDSIGVGLDFLDRKEVVGQRR